MSSWFSKVFDKKKEEEATAAAGGTVTFEHPASVATDKPAPRQRRVVNAPLLQAAPEPASGAGIRIKAQIDPSGEKIVLMLDRPVLAGYSCWCGSREEAREQSPLAAAIFAGGGVESVLLHDMNITVTRDGTGHTPGEAFARQLGQVVRAHFDSGSAAVLDSFLDGMPSEAEIRNGLQNVIDDLINPGIAAHSGQIILNRVTGNTAYITMGGGCQGCAASSITLRSGVEKSFRDAVPRLGALLDETDHSAGANPFFTQLPVGMGG